MASGDLPIRAGSYDVDINSWFDVRFTDGGIVLSLCDNEVNIRYTVMVSGGKVVYSEVGKLVSSDDRDIADIRADAAAMGEPSDTPEPHDDPEPHEAPEPPDMPEPPECQTD